MTNTTLARKIAESSTLGYLLKQFRPRQYGVVYCEPDDHSTYAYAGIRFNPQSKKVILWFDYNNVYRDGHYTTPAYVACTTFPITVSDKTLIKKGTEFLEFHDLWPEEFFRNLEDRLKTAWWGG